MTPTVSQLAALENHPHRSQFFCSIWRPQVLLQATVNVLSATRGLTSVPYSAGIGTGYGEILPGYVLCLGTAPGLSDVGRLLVVGKSGNQAAGTIYVAPNSFVWRPEYYLTVKKKRELAVKASQTINGIIYKEGVTYTNQNSLDWPVCICGPHRVGFLEAGQIVFEFDATPSYPSITSFQWTTTGGTLTNANQPVAHLTVTEGDLTSTNMGQFYVSCTVTNAAGTHTSYRSVFVHSDDHAGPFYPYQRWSFNSFPGANYEQGSWLTRLFVHGTADYDIFEDMAQVIIWHQPTYGSSLETAIGVKGAENQLFSGYILRGTVSADWEKSTVIFEAGSITEVMKRVRAMPFTLVAEPTANTWYQFAHPMTASEAIKHAARFGSNLLDICDVRLPTNLTTPFKTHDFQEGSLYQQMQGLIDRLPGRITANGAGQIWMQPTGQMLPVAAKTALPVAVTMTKAHQREEVVLVDRVARAAGVARVSGSTAEPGTGDEAGTIVEVPYCSIAPGDIPLSAGGDSTSLDNIILPTQAEADRLAGQLLAVDNRPIVEVRWKFAGNWAGVIDIAPAEIWQLSLDASYTKRGIEWVNQRLYVRSVDFDIDIKTGQLLVDAVFEPEVGDSDDGVPFDCETEMPKRPNPPRPRKQKKRTDGGGGEVGESALVSFSDAGSGCYLLPVGASVWDDRKGALTGDQIEDKGGAVDPFWTDEQDSTSADKAIILKTNIGQIYRSFTGGISWLQPVMPSTPDYWGDGGSPTNLTFTKIIPDPFNEGAFYALAQWQAGTNWRGALISTSNRGENWTYRQIDNSTPTHFLPLDLALSGRSTNIYITAWRDAELRLYKIQRTNFSVTANYDLGNCANETLLNSRYYFAFPRCPAGDDNRVFVAGRMIDPAGLTGDFSLIKSENAGSSWSGVIDDWSPDIIYDMRVRLETGGVKFYIIRKTPGTE